MELSKMLGKATISDWDIFSRRLLKSLERQQWDSLKQPFISPNNSKGPYLPKWKLNSDGKFTIVSVKKGLNQC